MHVLHAPVNARSSASPCGPVPAPRRVWDSLRSATRARCLVLFYRGRCLMQEGVAPAGQVGAAAPCSAAIVATAAALGTQPAPPLPHCKPSPSLLLRLLQAPGTASPGPICQQAMQSGTGNYLANLVLFPGAQLAGLQALSQRVACAWLACVPCKPSGIRLLCSPSSCSSPPPSRRPNPAHPDVPRPCRRPPRVCQLPAAQLPGGAGAAGGQGWRASGGQRHAARLHAAGPGGALRMRWQHERPVGCWAGASAPVQCGGWASGHACLRQTRDVCSVRCRCRMRMRQQPGGSCGRQQQLRDVAALAPASEPHSVPCIHCGTPPLLV